jgi:hypothetical protein
MRAAFLLAAIVAIASSACVVDNGPPPRRDAPAWAPPPSDPTPAPPTSTTDPPKIAIDDGQQLTSDPGAGAGVFVSYLGAGRWSIAWTCDTNTSGAACQFDVDARSHGITDLTATTTSDVASVSDGELVISASTTSTLERVSFQTAVGASIVLSSKIDGQPMPSLVFFVSNGKIRSAPTDPIELVPATP